MTTYRTIILLAALLPAIAGSAWGADAGGKWKSEFESPVGQLKYVFDLKLEGDKVTGKAIREVDGQKTETELKEGKVSGDQVSFVELLKFNDQEIRIEYKGKLAGNEIKFTRQVGDIATMEVVAKRDSAAPTAAAGDSVAGQWQSEFDSQIGKQKYLFTFKVDGEKLSGKANSEVGDGKFETELKEGKIKGEDITFVEPLNFQGNELRIEYTGKVSGDQIKFSRKVGDVATEELIAKRVKADSDGKSAAKKITLKVIKADSEETSGEHGEAANAVDGDVATFWHTQWENENPRPPHEIIVELIPPATIKGFTYLPRQDESDHGQIRDYEFYVSDDGKDFGKPIKKGAFAEADSKAKKSVTFEAKACRFIKLKALTEINDEAWASAAEIAVIVE